MGYAKPEANPISLWDFLDTLEEESFNDTAKTTFVKESNSWNHRY